MAESAPRSLPLLATASNERNAFDAFLSETPMSMVKPTTNERKAFDAFLSETPYELVGEPYQLPKTYA